MLPELLALVLDEPPELLPDPLPPLDPDPLAAPELPVLEALPDEPEPLELASDPLDVLASATSVVQDDGVVPHASELASHRCILSEPRERAASLSRLGAGRTCGQLPCIRDVAA